MDDLLHGRAAFISRYAIRFAIFDSLHWNQLVFDILADTVNL
jgi:hypothetical protein